MKNTGKFKRLLCLLVTMTMLVSLMAISASAATASDAKNGVVAILTSEGAGTGFAIGEKGKPVQYIVTNNHVVNGARYTTADVYFSLAANKKMIANVCYYNESKDIAILKLPEPTNERVPLVLCPKDKLDPVDDYFALGYPGNSLAITEWLQLSQNDITITRGGVKKNDTFYGVDVFYLDLTIMAGNSGGPLVNSKGEVAGINRGAVVIDGVSYENQAICVDELIRILNTEGIPFSQSGDINWLIVGGIAALAVLVLLVIVLIVLKAKKDETGGTGGTGKVDPVLPQSATLVAENGVLTGQRFSINGTVRIGRDASICGISYPVDTKGVSKLHCEVSYDGKVLYVRDLGSTYGTFTIDGTRLAKDQPHFLHSGDRFYIASRENTFVVSL